MNSLWAFLTGLVKAVFAGLVYYAGREQGRRVEKIEQNERVHESISEAKNAIARLDDDKRDKLRKRHNLPK